MPSSSQWARVIFHHGAAPRRALASGLAPGSNHKALAALSAAGVQDLTATARRHPGTKPVLVDALSIARPIARLHRNPSRNVMARNMGTER